MKKLNLIIIILAILILSGCSSFSINVEDLIEAPILSTEQSEITEALKKTLNTNKLKLKYPKYGEIHAPIIFENLDSDDSDEIIVFYEDTNDGSETTRINIMDKRDGNWVSIYDVPGESENIEFVAMANITSSVKKDLIVGWGKSEKRNKCLLNVYSYDEKSQSLKNILAERYDAVKIVSSFKDRNMSKIILLNYSSKTMAKMAAPISKNRLGVIAMTKLNSEIDSLMNAISYKGDNGDYLFLDFREKDGSYMTEVLKYTDESIENLMFDDSKENLLLQETKREERIFCEDVNGDGMPDVPMQKPLYGYKDRDSEEEQEETENLYLTEYYSFKTEEPIKIQTAFVNLNQGYKVIFPKKWQNDNITVRKQADREEYSFVKYGENGIDSQNVLLKIHLYAKDDYKDVFELQQFKKIAEKGNFEYYAYIPMNIENAEVNITYGELENMFKLLK